MAMIAKQFGRPHGPLGRLIGHGMARGNGNFGRWVVGEIGKERPDEAIRIVELGPGPGVALEETLLADSGFRSVTHRVMGSPESPHGRLALGLA